MVAPRNRKMVEEKTDVPGVGKVGPPIVKKDWGPIRLTVMQALKVYLHYCARSLCHIFLTRFSRLRWLGEWVLLGMSATRFSPFR